ncbi:MAG: LysR family transcriptional regulator [Rhodobiaceae bacterium]|nr:LysR family transcriptional regulator [Rhodobiaceae bacterium]
MFDIRDLEIIAALARHRHFARAAAECGISQPAFSARIKKLELDLGVPLVERGNRYQGLTPEGEIALKWARQMLDAADGLKQSIAAAKGSVSGQLTLGVVPTALAYSARIPAAMRAAHPNIALRVYSASSVQIRTGVEDYTFDAGITYLDGIFPPTIETRPLYEERYVLLAPAALAPRTSGTATWREAAALPLSTLTPEMQNRRIIESVFAGIGVTPNIVFETNAYTVSLMQVETGFAATIVPEILVDKMPPIAKTACLHLHEPEITRSIGVIFADRKPRPPVVRALEEVLGAVS